MTIDLSARETLLVPDGNSTRKLVAGPPDLRSWLRRYWLKSERARVLATLAWLREEGVHPGSGRAINRALHDAHVPPVRDTRTCLSRAAKQGHCIRTARGRYELTEAGAVELARMQAEAAAHHG